MTWKEFCDIGKDSGVPSNVPLWYQSVNYKKLRIPPRANGKSYEQMAESFLEKPRNIVLFGPPGRGKTHFTFALIRGLFDRELVGLGNLRFYKSKSLDDRILEEFKRFGSCTHFLRKLAEIPYLFLDDFGVERETDRTSRDYYELLDSRLYNMKTTVISTNLEEKAITNYFGDRVYSRLKEFIWVRFDGPDLRGADDL
jgi:DNA replication protein DnaC